MPRVIGSANADARDVARENTRGLEACRHGNVEVEMSRLRLHLRPEDLRKLRQEILVHLIVTRANVGADVDRDF